MMSGTFVFVYCVDFVYSESVFVGSFSFVVTARVFSGRRNERMSTAVSRYHQPLFRKSSMIAFAPDAVTFSRDFLNSSDVCSQKNATSIYPIFERAHVNIRSCVDGITMVPRVTLMVIGGVHSPRE